MLKVFCDWGGCRAWEELPQDGQLPPDWVDAPTYDPYRDDAVTLHFCPTHTKVAEAIKEKDVASEK